MKICMLTTTFPRYEGDFHQIFVYQLARNLVRQGIETEVVTSHSSETVSYEVMEGVGVYRYAYAFPKGWQKIAYQGGGIPATLRRSLVAKFQLPFFFLSFLMKSLKICRGCDVIHAHLIIPSGLIALLVNRVRRRPVVLTVHGMDAKIIKEKRLLRKIGFYILKNVDRIITTSHYLKKTVHELGILENEIDLIPYGVDTDEFKVTVKHKPRANLLWIGRMAPEKGLQYLLRAMKYILHRIPEAKLTLIGDGPLRENLERIANERLNIGNNVIFSGSKSHFAVPALMAKADVFVLPSFYEGSGLVLLEACACGVPCVASRVGGTSEFVEDGINGYLVEAGNEKMLAEKILILLENSELRRKMGENGRRKAVERFSWVNAAKRTKEIYKNLVKG